MEEKKIGGKSCYIERQNGSQVLLVQPVDAHDMEEMEAELGYLRSHSSRPFTLAAVKIDRWQEELSPWNVRPIFGKTPFGCGGADTLRFITNELVPALKSAGSKVCIGGYSLAGLFALWAGYETVIDGVAAASPSVWFDGWLDYATAHSCKAGNVYLSLGDRESHSRTKRLQNVDKEITKQYELLTEAGINAKLEWNEGNHFQENGVRMAKGFEFLIESL